MNIKSQNLHWNWIRYLTHVLILIKMLLYQKPLLCVQCFQEMSVSEQIVQNADIKDMEVSLNSLMCVNLVYFLS